MSDEPAWWRGQRPSEEPPTGWVSDELVTGRHAGRLPTPGSVRDGLRTLDFFRAQVSDVEIRLDDAHLGAAWSELDRCHFRQRVRPVTNEHGVAAQGSFGTRPTVYRGCTFERVRFKTLGGFVMGDARFEDCIFLDCRWEGHFADRANLLRCTFVGRMNGCVWFGGDAQGRRNVNEGNDFTRTVFTSNVAWRDDFPLDDQRWPDGFTPVVDDRNR